MIVNIFVKQNNACMSGYYNNFLGTDFLTILYPLSYKQQSLLELIIYYI